MPLPTEDADTLLPAALFAEVLSNAIEDVRKRGTPVYTFALYHDHESAAVSVCIDTEANSLRCVTRSNEYGMKHFATAVAAGDLKSAELWSADGGRSLSLGDFALVNLARTSLDDITAGDGFYVAMLRSLGAAAASGRVVTHTRAAPFLLFGAGGRGGLPVVIEPIHRMTSRCDGPTGPRLGGTESCRRHAGH